MPKSLDQTFSYRNLIRVRRKEDASLFPHPEAIRDAKLKKLAADLDSGTFTPAQFMRTVTAKGFPLYWTDSYENTLVLRKLNDSIRRLYRVRFSDRTAIVRQVRSLLSEGCPKQIIRMDLRSFYENVDREAVLAKLRQEHLLSAKSKMLLDWYFKSAFPSLGSGLPRGICLSSTLSELALRRFDLEARRIPGVYFYARYVDDIIVFSFSDGEKVRSEIQNILPNGLHLNEKKSERVWAVRACRCDLSCSHTGQCPCKDKKLNGIPCNCKAKEGALQALSFLGYEFTFSDIASRSKKADVGVSIASSKVKKIKTRIMLALKDYATGGDFSLLRDRILFLSGNYTVRVASNDKRVKAGIYYNYRLLNPDANETENVLRGLNAFLRQAVYSKTLKFVSTLTRAQRDELARFSFVSGFRNRRPVKLLPQRVYQVKGCWQDA